MIQVRDVKSKIAAVLANEISVEDFARWIMSNSWNMHKDSPEAVDLVSDVHLLLAERDPRNAQVFRHALALLLNNRGADEQVVSMQIVISFAPVGQSAAVIAGAVRPLVLPELQLLLPAN